MTYYRIGTIQTFIGSSTDSKPTSGVPYGSKFYETDNTIWYIYGSTGWSVYREGTKST